MNEEEFIEQININKGSIHSACSIYCQSHERADLVQEIILSAWKSIDTFRKESKFNTWLHSIARNVCISALRKPSNKIKVVGLEEYIDVLVDTNYDPYVIEQLDIAKRYNSVLNTIEQPYRTAFDLYLNGLDFKSIEQKTGIDQNNLRVKIHRIKKQLHIRYGNMII